MAITKTVTKDDGEVTVFSESTYNFLKKLVQVGLPALGTLYFAIAQIWGLPKADEVVGTIVAISAFLGVLLQISSSRYEKSDAGIDGHAIVDSDPGGITGVSLELNKDPELLVDQEKMTFKVQRPGP